MKTLYIERSTGACRDGGWIAQLDLSVRPGRIVVGTGPGSFAGIRAALAFAQGWALGAAAECEVLGLPSACASAAAALDAGAPRVAVVGDARQGQAWVALFDGFSLVRDVFQVAQSELRAAVPVGWAVVTPDEPRIGTRLKAVFGTDYLGARLPTAEGLRRYAEAAPSALVREPRPIYLNPAVRN